MYAKFEMIEDSCVSIKKILVLYLAITRFSTFINCQIKFS